MDAQTVGVIVASILGIIGVIGGIPQILQWSKPKPHLKIVELKLSRMVNLNYRVHSIIENTKVFWSRNADARDVKAEFIELDKNRVQLRVANTSIENILSGAKAEINADVGIIYRPELNPHALILRVTPSEGEKISKQIIFNH